VGGHVARMGGKRNVYRLLVGKPEGRRPLGRPRCRWVDGSFRDRLGRCGLDWSFAQHGEKWRALVNAVKHLRVP
jgi:hypothetical protein